MITTQRKLVCIVGVGYIGLPTALLAAQSHFNVVAYDTDHTKISRLKQGKTSICEQELVSMLTIQQTNPHLSFTTTPQAHADFYVISVPTPVLADHRADVSYVMSAVETIAPLLKKGSCVIVESTIPVFLTQKIADYLEKETCLLVGQELFVAHCPERVLPGNMIFELTHNDRIIGGISQACTEKAIEFYTPFVKGKLHTTSAKGAELVKLIENSTRDVQIALANQIDELCTTAQVNSREIIALANHHPRINILEPGPGVGGHCIAVDPWFLINEFPKETELFALARKVNSARPLLTLNRITAALNGIRHKSPNRKVSIGIWGLTFKPNVDDMRESPALEIAQHLIALNDPHISFHAVEPHVHPSIIQEMGFTAEADPERSLDLADGIIVLVKHKAFKEVDHSLLTQKVLYDACGLVYEIQKKGSISDTFTFGKITAQTTVKQAV